MDISDEKPTKKMVMATKWGNKIGYPLHAFTIKPIVDLIARLKLLITVCSYICVVPQPPLKTVQDVPPEAPERKSISTEDRVAEKTWKFVK